MQMDANFNLSQTPQAWSDFRAGFHTVRAAKRGRLTRSQTMAMKAALHNEPDVRPDQVNKAIDLIAQVEWPPKETIRRFAVLLAAKMSEAGE
jgi:hypothetical protein